MISVPHKLKHKGLTYAQILDRYACTAWGTNLTTKQIQTLSTVQGLAQRLITRVTRSTPKHLMNIILNLKPIEIKIEETIILRLLSMKAEGHMKYITHV